MADIDFKVGVKIETTGEEKIDALEKKIEQLKSTNKKVKVDVDGSNSDISNYFKNIQKQASDSGKQVGNAFQKSFKSVKFNGDSQKFVKDYLQNLKDIRKEAQRISKDEKVPGTDATKAANALFREQEKQLKGQQKFFDKLEASKKRIDKLQNDFNSNKFADKYKDTSKFKTIEDNLNRINKLNGQLNAELSKGSDMNIDKVNSDLKEMNTLLGKSETAFNGLVTPISKMDAELASDKTLAWLKSNTKAAKEYGDILLDLSNIQRNAKTKGELDQATKQIRAIQADAQTRGLVGKSWFEDFSRGFKQIFQFVGTYGILQNVMQDLPRAMVQNVSQVDDAMTNLRMATSVSKQEAQELMQTYSNMGRELKVLGTDVAKSSTEWLKQGKSIKETDSLAKDSIILSKIGDMSSEDATKTITAAMKSYDLNVDEVSSFVDKISAIDMASATNVQGLSQAFNEVAANARLAGVESEKLLSYSAVIGETTQEGMASVGTSLNAIFSRMGNIKLSRLKDFETGEDLSNVETVLKKVGIQLRDSEGQFRDFDAVLDDTASKWKNFDSVTQRAVANAFAGTHNANNFVILMEQYEKAQEYMELANSSSGQSAEKFQAYQESLSGSVEGFKNAFQSLSNTTIDSGFLTGFVDAGTGLLNFLDSAIDKFGAFKSLLAIGGGIFAQKNGLGKRNAIPYKVKQNIAVLLT